MGCVVCGHAKRAAIEAAADAAGADILEVAIAHEVTAAGLARHLTRHPRAAAAELEPVLASPLRDRPARASRRAPTPRAAAPTMPPPAPVLPPPSRGADEPPATSRSAEIVSERRRPSSAREKVERLVDSLQRIAERIERDPEAPIAAQLTVLRGMVGPLRLLGTFTGEIGASETRVASSPFYRRVRSAIVDSLRSHPDAAASVIAALERVERGDDSEQEKAA